MGSALLHRLVKQVVGDAQGWAQRHKAIVAWQAISVVVMRFVAQQLLPMTAVVTTSELPSTSDPWGGVASGMQVAAEDRGADVGIRGAVATGSESALPMGPGVGRPGTPDERGEAATPAPPVGRAMALLGMPGMAHKGQLPSGWTQWAGKWRRCERKAPQRRRHVGCGVVPCGSRRCWWTRSTTPATYK